MKTKKETRKRKARNTSDYIKRKKELGYIRVEFLLTEAEKEKIKNYLDEIRIQSKNFIDTGIKVEKQGE